VILGNGVTAWRELRHMTVRRGAAGTRRHLQSRGRRAVAFDGVRSTLAGDAPKGARRRVPVAPPRWSTSCPYCRAPLLSGPTGELPAYLRPGSLARCGGGVPAVPWAGVAAPVGAGFRSW
jgi:hypothetical protein